MAIGPPTDAERAFHRAALRKDAALDDADVAAIEPHLRTCRLARGASFLRPGDRAVWCGTIVAGVTRELYPLEDGREVTRGFAGPGDYVGSLSDLLTDAPARSSVVAEADAVIVVVPWARIREVAARPAWAALLARVTEKLYLAKAEREYELLALDAAARYQRFRARYAALEPHIAQRHVASYIGVTPEHLSRLRRKLGAAGTSARPGSRARSR